jgi:hypothetical protein
LQPNAGQPRVRRPAASTDRAASSFSVKRRMPLSECASDSNRVTYFFEDAVSPSASTTQIDWQQRRHFSKSLCGSDSKQQATV